MNIDLTDKTIVVTGASRGIGEGIARSLVAAGSNIIGTYKTGIAEAESLSQELGTALRMLQVDLESRDSVAQFVDDLTKVGAIDGLVNNAGAIDFQLWDEFTMESWRSVFAVNVDSVVALTFGLRNVIAPGGAIVNIASTDGFTGSFGSIAYSASKAALINVTKSLGNLLGPAGIRVNAVCPGWIDTGMSTEASFEAGKLTPLGRNGTPQDVAGLVAFLLSPEAAFINGAAIVVDGGYTNVDSIMKQEYADLTSEQEDNRDATQ